MITMNKSKSVGRPSIAISTKQVKEVVRLASLGLSDSQIAESVGLTYATFRRNKAQFEQSLKDGRSALRVRISEAMLTKVDDNDTAVLIFTAKRLNLFQQTIDVSVPKTITEALAQLGIVYAGVASGQISESFGDKLAGYLDRFMRAIELTELEERIQKIEGQKK